MERAIIGCIKICARAKSYNFLQIYIDVYKFISCILTRCMIILRHRDSCNQKGEIIPKTKKFGFIGMGDLTFLFKSCEIDRSQGRLL